MIKRILVGLGGTSFTRVAIRRAVELARTHFAELTGVTVVDVARLSYVGAVPIGAGSAAAELREHRLAVTREHVEAAVEDFQAACSAARVPYRVRREENDPFDQMVLLSRQHDLMVFGLRSLFDYGVLGDETYDPAEVLARLSAEGSSPILATSDAYRPIRRVMMCYSPSMESARMLKRLVPLQLWPESEVCIACFTPHAEDAESLLSEAEDYCRSHGVCAKFRHVEEDLGVRALAEAAEWDADLIAMAHHGPRTWLVRRLFGDAILDVLQNADRPILLA